MKKVLIGVIGVAVVVAGLWVPRFYFELPTLEGAIALADAGSQMKDSSDGTEVPNVPVAGMVTMLDLGATSCVPCKMMAPILEKLEKDYRGKAAIVFIDVWKNREPAKRFGIRAIPTQIFFDAHGREVYRHVGFMNEEAIVAQLKKMGVERGS